MYRFYSNEDKNYYSMLKHMEIAKSIDIDSIKTDERIETYPVVYPDDEYGFLHEAAIIEFKGRLFASWYNNTERELQGFTPIRESRSSDGGKTWTKPETVVCDDTLLYCPPVYGICDGKLYMLVNSMVSADHMHSLELFVLNEETDKYERLWSRPIPFKLNTNVYTLPNGKLMLPGRIAELDGFPNTPAVLISDSGKIDAEWRLVKIQQDGNLADGSKLVHPELSAVVTDDKVYVFSRNDERKVPLIYVSEDNCESWSEVMSHDIPFSATKIYSGTLSIGKHYVIGNIGMDRTKLCIFTTDSEKFEFTKGIIIKHGIDLEIGADTWHYPVAYEADGKLYVIYSFNIGWSVRGAAVSVIPIEIL